MASALVESIRFNFLNIAKLLLENVADPSIIEVMEGSTPFSVAKKKNNFDTIELINSCLRKN